LAVTSASVTSPTTITVARSGRSRAATHAFSSAWVSPAMLASVPVPLGAVAYGWPAP
jgi:hypothetical protein